MKKVLWILFFILTQGSFTLPAQISEWKPTPHFNYYMVSDNGLYGLTDTNYNLVVAPRYQSIQVLTPTIALIKRDGKYGLMNCIGKEIVDPLYGNIDTLPKSQYFSILDEDGYGWGVMDSTGHVLVNPRYKKVEMYNEDLFLATYSGEPFNRIIGLLDHNGDTIVPLIYHKIWNLNDTLFGVELPTGVSSERLYCGVYDIHGNMILRTKYQTIKKFSSKYLLLQQYVSYADSFFVVDLRGKKFSFDEVGKFSEGLHPASVNYTFGYIDTMMNTVIPYMYKDAKPFYNGIAQVKLNGGWGCINVENEVIIPFQFAESGKTNADGSITYRQGDTTYLYSRKGTLLSTSTSFYLIDQRVWSNHDEDNYYYHMFVENGHLGLTTMDKKDTIVMAEYDLIYNYENGMAKVKKDGKMSFIDKNGKLLFPFKYDYLGDLSNGMAVAMLDGKVGFISSKGVEVTPCIYEAATNFDGAYAYVKQGNEILIIDITGSVTGKYNKKIDWDAEFYQWVNSAEY